MREPVKNHLTIVQNRFPRVSDVMLEVAISLSCQPDSVEHAIDPILRVISPTISSLQSRSSHYRWVINVYVMRGRHHFFVKSKCYVLGLVE